jgi:hypothetical protein
MADETIRLTGPGVAVPVLAALCLLMWAVIAPSLYSVNGGDAAGTAMAQAFAALAMVALWIMIAILAIVTAAKGGMPLGAIFAAVVLIPASAVVATQALELLARPHLPPYHWPIVIPAIVPPLIVLYCLWTRIPVFRAAIPSAWAGGVCWGGVLFLCVAIGPLGAMRDQAVEALRAEQQKIADAFAAVPQDAPLWAWLPFLTSDDQRWQSDALEKIKHAERRQPDAEVMLDRGDFPLRLLGVMDLDPTPSLCDKARALLRRKAAVLAPHDAPFPVVRDQVRDAVPAISWLVGHDCPCEAEIHAWQAVIAAYPDIGYEQFELRDLLDPQALGRTLREYPERFSMLTPKAHLRAWLKFTDDPVDREQAIAGARTLDHRTSDAVAMLMDRNDMSAAPTVLKYLPDLDLEPTQPLCDAALARVHDDFARIYRPTPDDPRTYADLLDRLPTDDPLRALRWLAGHGCAANPGLEEAIALIRTYQDSPASAAMIASLEQLRR